MLKMELHSKPERFSAALKMAGSEIAEYEGLVEGYEASWTVDSNEEFMLETAVLEFIEIDVLEGKIEFGGVKVSRVVDTAFMAMIPHLPSLIEFLWERKKGEKELNLFEDGITFKFFFRKNIFVTQTGEDLFQLGLPRESEEKSPIRLISEACDVLNVFQSSVHYFFPKLFQRKEYQSWLIFSKSGSCREARDAQRGAKDFFSERDA